MYLKKRKRFVATRKCSVSQFKNKRGNIFPLNGVAPITLEVVKAIL